MNNSDKITREYEKKHLRNIKGYQLLLHKQYLKVIDKIFAGATTARMIGDNFSIDQNPILKKLIDAVLTTFKEEVTTLMVNGIDAEWELAESKMDAIVSNNLSKRKISEVAKKALFSRRESALESFKKRKTKGLDLSDRVWNYSNQFRNEIEHGLFLGISEGKSAAAMARDQKKYLKEPERLYRRVRDAKGNLVLSKEAKKYKPGRGVYRSSYKNALRTTRTETNMAYRTADNERYARTKFILGFEVKLSANHPAVDICDHLAGKYPSDFKFNGWHPNCLCFTVPVLPSAEEYDKYEDALLAGKGDEFQFKNPITKVPPGFNKYLVDNKDKLNSLKSKPYWVRDNFKNGDVSKGLNIEKAKAGKQPIPNKPVTPEFKPKNLDKYLSKDNLTSNDEIFSLLNKETKLTLRNTEGSYYIPDKETVNLSYKTIRGGTWKPQSVLYHEFGHAADWQNGIKEMTEIKSIMKKYRNEFSKNENALYKKIDKTLWEKGYAAANSNNFDEMYQVGAAHDTLMSLNKNFGSGHTKAYFSQKGFPEAEFIAHMFENKYVGNKVFKEVMPELYEESIKVITEIVDKIKSK